MNFVRLASLLALSGCLGNAAERWIKVRSSNFELLTTASERKGREAALYFEQVRGLFATLSTNHAAPREAVRIVAFGSEKEFAPDRPNEFAAAYYVSANDRDYIVMKSLGSENFPIAVHEYVHLSSIARA